ncbi:MAG: DUF3085 domain-containing protein [Thalassobaculaceae bacterium]
MYKLEFKTQKSLINLARQTLENKYFSIPWTSETTTDKCICLVKDDGVYVMNAFDEDKKYRNSEEANLVSYAKGLDPKKNADIWEDCYLVSPDDFAENIALNDGQLKRIANGGDLTIWIDDEKIKVVA